MGMLLSFRTCACEVSHRLGLLIIRVMFLCAAGSINISNILTGKCLAKIRASNCSPKDDCCCCSKKRTYASRIRNTVAEALEDITALFYDEDRNEIYTGNRQGLVHVWSNWLFTRRTKWHLEWNWSDQNAAAGCLWLCIMIFTCSSSHSHFALFLCIFDFSSFLPFALDLYQSVKYFARWWSCWLRSLYSMDDTANCGIALLFRYFLPRFLILYQCWD